MNIILIGAQGSGKGTQAEKIADELGLRHFSTGDAFRAEAASGSELGQKLKGIMEAGELVSDDIVNEVVKNTIQNYEGPGIIFDGYPRTIEQALFLDSITKIDAVIEIAITDDESVRRISSRYSCPKCKAVYNVVTKPPKTEGICDNDGEKIIQRDDDKEEAVRRRLADYHAQADLIIKHYNEKGTRIHPIDGQQPIDKVFADIEKALE